MDLNHPHEDRAIWIDLSATLAYSCMPVYSKKHRFVIDEQPLVYNREQMSSWICHALDSSVIIIAYFQAFNAMLWCILVNNCNVTFLICSCSIQPEHTQVSIYCARMLVTRKCNCIHLPCCPHLWVIYSVLYLHSSITQLLELPWPSSFISIPVLPKIPGGTHQIVNILYKTCELCSVQNISSPSRFVNFLICLS